MRPELLKIAEAMGEAARASLAAVDAATFLPEPGTTMSEYTDELQRLRAENDRLRASNEQLRVSGGVTAVGTTVWKNTTDQTVKFKLFKGPGPAKTAWQHVEIKPGESVALSSEYDRAIQTTDRTGIVIGGHAPLLVKMGAPPPDVHFSLVRSHEQGVAEAKLKGHGVVGEPVSLDALAAIQARMDRQDAEAKELAAKVAAKDAEKDASERRIRELEAALVKAKAEAEAPKAEAG